MEEKKLYFKNIDDTFCYCLEDQLDEARIEGLSEITLVEAIPEDGTSDHIWCMAFGECIERSECKKSRCGNYSSTSGRGKCKNKGKMYLHGEEVTFNVEPLMVNTD